MDTISYNVLPKQRYFTVMSSLPGELNREQILSQLGSVSQVVALNILQIHRHDQAVQRVALVEVEDSESVYRLTSRQFLVGNNQAVKHKSIAPASKLVEHCINKDLLMRLKFFSTERNISRTVTEFFEKFGELGVLSMKAYNGHHDLLFKVPREYSVRSVSTDLVVKVNGVDVLVEYPEDDINFDFYEKDL